ncbi:MAG: hypothetical protein SFZ03_05590 [Candidatus Melainabacteria bacterium]|nr:hypothetical protein [Candidatus Melainabacteria bacterium]
MSVPMMMSRLLFPFSSPQKRGDLCQHNRLDQHDWPQPRKQAVSAQPVPDSQTVRLGALLLNTQLGDVIALNSAASRSFKLDPNGVYVNILSPKVPTSQPFYQDPQLSALLDAPLNAESGAEVKTFADELWQAITRCRQFAQKTVQHFTPNDERLGDNRWLYDEAFALNQSTAMNRLLLQLNYKPKQFQPSYGTVWGFVPTAVQVPQALSQLIEKQKKQAQAAASQHRTEGVRVPKDLLERLMHLSTLKLQLGQDQPLTLQQSLITTFKRALSGFKTPQDPPGALSVETVLQRLNEAPFTEARQQLEKAVRAYLFFKDEVGGDLPLEAFDPQAAGRHPNRETTGKR